MKCILCLHEFRNEKDRERKAELKACPLGGQGIGAAICARHLTKALEWVAERMLAEGGDTLAADVMAALEGDNGGSEISRASSCGGQGAGS